jgi:EAL domain-containing protein (putative c-di-GMP-specific phosphodiesterase class I)
MADDETKAGLQRVLDALTSDEPGNAAAPPATEEPAAPADVAPREDHLALWYQPKIDIKQRCLAGAEALIRVGEAQESTGTDEDAVARRTEQALLAILRDWTLFDEAGFNLRLSLDVPVHLLDRLPIAKLVTENRPKAEHWPGLIVEVAEDEIVRDIRRSKEIIERIRVGGLAIAIDDFGAGYSSFSSLRELSFAELKLNSSFVKGCAGDPTSAAICQTAIDLAHRFGSSAVAEGIETVADLQAMQIMGCDFGQGNLIAPPLPMTDFMAMLQRHMNKGRAPKSAPATSTGGEQAPPAAASA